MSSTQVACVRRFSRNFPSEDIELRNGTDKVREAYWSRLQTLRQLK